MNKQIDLNEYSNFVDQLTSLPSKDLTTMINRLDRIDGNYEAYGANGEMQQGPDINVPMFVTSAMGMCSEAGEFMEIAKKCLWQGKNLSDDVLYHLKRELGDQIFYWTMACRALRLDPNEVIEENVRKLESRYPGGKFDVHYSENRQAGDL